MKKHKKLKIVLIAIGSLLALLIAFVVSNNITINNLETLNLGFKNTDHNPVKMNITLN